MILGGIGVNLFAQFANYFPNYELILLKNSIRFI